jgi:outer membrane protein OmpA-like peptidoglycan-associated protein
MKAFKPSDLGMLALAAVLLAGCAATSDPAPHAAAAAPRFPDAGSAWLKNGSFVDVAQLRRIGRGMNKNQVRELISYPHFGEGLFGPAEWDYLFNFRTGKGDDYVTCQYKVVFDQGLTSAMHWKDPACADYLKPTAAEPSARAAPPAPVASEQFDLGADALFAFDRSGPSDILPEGRRQLDMLAATLKGRYTQITRISVAGHTDRLGSSSYNQSLSLARANTVRGHLVQAGLPTQEIEVQGKGELEPKVQCEQAMPREQLIDCLAPNRRVEIKVLGGR